jgi:hypothetical protein
MYIGINVSSFITSGYMEFGDFGVEKNKANPSTSLRTGSKPITPSVAFRLCSGQEAGG